MTFPAPIWSERDPGYFIWPVVSVFAANTILFFICQIFCKRDNSWIDSMWSLLFCISNATIWILKAIDGEPITVRMIMITVPVFIWGLRLSVYIFIRHTREDYRYVQMREGWEKGGSLAYFIKAYMYVYVLQGTFQFFNNASVLFVNIYAKGEEDVEWTDILGVCVWALGFGIEVLSDSQLTDHLRNPRPGTGKFIKSGLWRYSRHPNYFGEAVMWWGLFIIACGLDYGWITVFAPMFITFLLRFVSGVPFPEKKYASNPEWQKYCTETNVFALWFAKVDYAEGEDGFDKQVLA